MKNLILYISIISVAFAYTASDSTLVLKTYSTIDSDYLDENDVSTINMLFVQGLNSHIKNIETSSVSCDNKSCALEQLSKAQSNQVVYSQLQKLGAKIIFSAVILDSNSSFESRATAMNVEDMEQVCLRLSKSIALRESVEEVADIDNIIEKEEEEPLRRTSLNRVGLSAGYLFPLGDSFHDQSQILKFGANYYYEFQNNTALMAELETGTSMMGVDLNFLKFTNNVDTSPFYGFGMGLYGVFSSVEANNSDEGYSGMALNLQSGIMVYRTYDVNVLARARYLHIFNSNSDNAFVIDIIFQKKMKERKKNRVVNRYPVLELLLPK